MSAQRKGKVSVRKENWLTGASKKKRLTFTFPFVHENCDSRLCWWIRHYVRHQDPTLRDREKERRKRWDLVSTCTRALRIQEPVILGEPQIKG